MRAALKGDCHTHSTWSDGGASIETMARTAMALGHEYLVLTDHSPRLTVAHGLDRERLREQLERSRGVNEQLAPFRILTGIEVDILADGALDQDEDLLGELDVVVASVHSKLSMERSGDDRAHGAWRWPARTSTSSATAPGARCEGAGPTRRSSDRRPRSTPRSCSRRAPGSTPRSRSTAGPSARTRPTSCSSWRSSGAARSASTPTPTPRASSSGRTTAATRRRGTSIDPADDRQHLGGRRPHRLDGHASHVLNTAGIGARGDCAGRVLRPHVEEDEQAQDQRPPQEGEPRHQAERRSRLILQVRGVQPSGVADAGGGSEPAVTWSSQARTSSR